MKKFLLPLLLTLGTLGASSLESVRTDLTQFRALAHRCAASLRATSEKETYDRFRDVAKTYDFYKHELDNIDILDEDSLRAAHKDCLRSLQANVVTRTPSLVLQPAPQTPPETSPQQNILTFDLALDTFQQEYKESLLRDTTQKRMIQRFLAHLGVELASEFASKQAKKAHGQSASTKNWPTAHQRCLESIPHDSEQWKLYGKLVGIASARVGAYCMIDEILPRGVSTYKQRLLELVGPLIVASVLLSMVGKGDAVGGCIKAFTRFMMTRALLERKDPLYKVVNGAAVALPFFMGVGRKVLFNNYPINSSMIPTMLIDGVSSMVIYDLLPKSIDRATPRSMPFNPAHRRKALKNLPREVAAKFNDVMSSIAYANA